MPVSEHLAVPLRIAIVVVPVAVYFLILGLFNSRRHPLLLSGRCDFALLIAAMSPLFVLPLLEVVGVSPATLLVVLAGMAGCIRILRPAKRTWVIYNITEREANRIVGDALRSLGMEITAREKGFELVEQGATVDVNGFSLLRNVSVRIRGGDDDLPRRLQLQLSRRVSSIRAEVSPMAVALLLVATGMLVAPLTLMAHRAVEIVRILTDLLH